MAFTAGSVELAKAQKLGTILSGLAATYGITAMSGFTGANMIEQRARELGFGITGITTGAGFPPFGTMGATINNFVVGHAITAVLQNPSGLTRPNGITVGTAHGQTVGLYMRKFVRDGSDVTVTTSSGVAGTTIGFSTNTAVNAGFTASLYFAVATGSTGVWSVN